MGKKIYVLGERKDIETLSSCFPDLEKQGYIVNVTPLERISEDWTMLINSEEVVFCLSSSTPNAIYTLSAGRFTQKKRSINVITGPVELTQEQKQGIGRNKTIFLSLSKHTLSQDILKILNSKLEWGIFEQEPDGSADITEENLTPVQNQYDEEGNIILPVYDEPKNGKIGIILGIIGAACIIGFGIWGYSAYVESVKQEADLAVWNAWEEYLKVTNAGQIFSTLGENIENIDHDSFSERKFNEYIKNNIEPSPDINWGDIGPLVKNIKIEVPPLREITPIMTENLRSLYTKMDDSDYRDQGGWDPIAEMKETNNITITDIVVSTDGKTGKVNYHTSLDASGESPKAIYMLKNDRDLWEISDFKQDGVSFFATVQNFFDEKERNRVVNYEGNVYTSSGTFPITLEINYGVSPITALYHNVEYNVSLEMTGYEGDGYLYLSCDNTGETVAFKLERKSDEVLIGEFIVTPNDGDVKTYDVVLNTMVFED